MISKSVSDSRVELAQLMMPEHANPAGNVHGGTIMKIVDNAALMAAMRHTRSNCVTASVDRIDFITPVYVGNLVIAKASINYVSRTSMEIGVRVEAECMITGTKTHVSSAYLTFVALDKVDHPKVIPEITFESDLEHKRYEAAKQRRELRLKNRKKHKHQAEMCILRPK